MWYHIPIVFALSVASASVNYSPGEILVDAISKQSSTILQLVGRHDEVGKLYGRLVADFGAATALDASNIRGTRTKQNAAKAAAAATINQSVEDLRAALLAELSYLGNKAVTLARLSEDIAPYKSSEITKSGDALNVLKISQHLYNLVNTRVTSATGIVKLISEAQEISKKKRAKLLETANAYLSDAEADRALQKDMLDQMAAQVRRWIEARKLADQRVTFTTTYSPESSTSAPQDTTPSVDEATKEAQTERMSESPESSTSAPQDTTPSADETTKEEQTEIMSEPSVKNLEEFLDDYEHIERGDYDELYAPYEEITDKELDEAFEYLFPQIDLSECSSTFDFCDGVDDAN